MKCPRALRLMQDLYKYVEFYDKYFMRFRSSNYISRVQNSSEGLEDEDNKITHRIFDWFFNNQTMSPGKKRREFFLYIIIATVI